MDERILAVLRAVATIEPCECGRPDDCMWCPFRDCDAFADYPQEGQELQHTTQCPVTLARTLIREAERGAV